MYSNPGNATSERSLAEMLHAIQGLDMERGLRFASGRLDTYVRRLRKFAASHIETANELRAAQAYRDPVELEHIAHSLRGLAAFLGATDLQHSAAAVEIGLRSEPDWDVSARQVESLCATHQQLLLAIGRLPAEAEFQSAA